MKKLTLNQIHNLSINCDSQAELNEWLKSTKTEIKASLVAYPFTLLPIYYLKPSKNDPENKLKYVGLRQYASRHDYVCLNSDYTVNENISSLS